MDSTQCRLLKRNVCPYLKKKHIRDNIQNMKDVVLWVPCCVVLWCTKQEYLCLLKKIHIDDNVIIYIQSMKDLALWVINNNVSFTKDECLCLNQQIQQDDNVTIYI